MKRLLLPSLAITAGMALSTLGFADTMSATTNSAPMVNMDQVSYAIGYNVGSDFKKQNIAANPSQIAAGMQAALSGATPTMTPAQMKATLEAFQKQMVQQLKAQEKQIEMTNLQKSQAFIAQIAKKPGVQKLADGLYYQVLTKGTGAIPTSSDTVQVNYEGSLIDGTVFDSSFQRGKPVSFAVNQVIPGWTQALEHMPVGSTWMLYIAPDLAYGKFAPPQIGPNQALQFKVELLSIVPASNTTAASVNMDSTQN